MSSLTSPSGEPERLATGRIAEDRREHMKPRVTLRKKPRVTLRTALEDPELLGFSTGRAYLARLPLSPAGSDSGAEPWCRFELQ